MRETNPHLCLAEADDDLRTSLTANLRADDYDVYQAATLEHVRLRLAARIGVLVLGEIGTQAQALAVLADLRAGRTLLPLDPQLPVITLGPAGDELAELRALRAGADDHLEKPIRYLLLHARLQALERRVRLRAGPGRLRIGALELDPLARAVSVAGRQVALPNAEFELLYHLAAQPTRVFTKDQLLRDVWGFRSPGRTRTVDSHACRLRQRLAQAGGRYVHTVWGIGYRLLDPAVSADDNGGAA